MTLFLLLHDTCDLYKSNITQLMSAEKRMWMNSLFKWHISTTTTTPPFTPPGLTVTLVCCTKCQVGQLTIGLLGGLSAPLARQVLLLQVHLQAGRAETETQMSIKQ